MGRSFTLWLLLANGYAPTSKWKNFWGGYWDVEALHQSFLWSHKGSISWWWSYRTSWSQVSIPNQFDASNNLLKMFLHCIHFLAYVATVVLDCKILARNFEISNTSTIGWHTWWHYLKLFDVCQYILEKCEHPRGFNPVPGSNLNLNEDMTEESSRSKERLLL